MCAERNAIKQAIEAVLQNSLEVVTHEFEDDHGNEGSCELRILREQGVLVLVCTGSPSASRSSITNAAPAPWEQAEDEHREPTDTHTVWIEHSRTEIEDGQVRHQFDQAIPLAGALTGVKWKQLGVRVAGGNPRPSLDDDPVAASFEIGGVRRDTLLFAVEEQLDGGDDDDAACGATSYIRVDTRGAVDLVVLESDNATLVGVEEVLPKDCVMRAQAVAAVHAASHGMSVNASIVAIEP